MIEEQAVVTALQDDQVLLEVVRRTPCGLCGKTRGCGISLWGGLPGHRNRRLRAANVFGLQAGDQVIVGVDERALLSSSLAVYGIPGFALLLGAAAGAAIARPASSDLWAGAGAIAGLVIGALWLRARTLSATPDPRYQPVILRQIDSQSCALVQRKT